MISPVDRIRLLSRQLKFGTSAAYLLGALISLYATLPKVIWNEWDYLLFPIKWLFEVGATLIGVWLCITFLPVQIRRFSRRIVKNIFCGFVLGYVALAIVGFDWTGYWLRFALFRSGLRDEVKMHIAGPSDWNVYHWGATGIAGMENDYYLISDPSNKLADLDSDEPVLGMSCPLAANRLLWPSWRLVVTYNCTFE